MGSSRVDEKHLQGPLRRGSDRERVVRDGGGGDHVIVVDDDVRVLATVQRMLEHDGAIVWAFPDALSALERLRTHPGVALILTDGNMPGLSGSHFVQVLRVDERLKSVPIIGMSGSHYGFPDGITELPKPFTIAELRSALKLALGRGFVRR